jgi:hypothetical protein
MAWVAPTFNCSGTGACYLPIEETAMTACSSCSSSSTPTTLAQAQAKLASDESDKASPNTISSDEAEVAQFQKAQTPIGQGTVVDIVA